MDFKKVTMIVPRLPPSVDGLGDYGISLARQMRADFGIQTDFIVGDPKWTGGSELDGFKVIKISARNAESLLMHLPSDHKVILHYVGYGYAKRGCPIWLINALSKWRGNTNNKLITMFHELYAFGPVWNSQFWTSPLQRYLAKKLSLITDYAVTSKVSYASLVNSFSHGKHTGMPVLAIFSNIGEPKIQIPLSNRNKTLVVFGGRGARTRVYSESKEELVNVCHKFGITEIIDIGPLLDITLTKLRDIKVTTKGILEAKDIGDLLLSSSLGFMNYPPAYLCKSGIFAAYCSHGVLPLVSTNITERTDEVTEGEHYLIATNEAHLVVDPIRAQEIADQALNWYKGHTISVHAEVFNNFL